LLAIAQIGGCQSNAEKLFRVLGFIAMRRTRHRKMVHFGCVFFMIQSRLELEEGLELVALNSVLKGIVVL